MIFVKERNLIVAYEGENKLGGWDITTGNFIGKKGTPIKSVPACFTFDKLPYSTFENGKLNLGTMIRLYRNWNNECDENYTPAYGARFEEMISVGLVPASYRDLKSDIRLTKDIVDFCKKEFHSYYHNEEVLSYVIKKKYSHFLENKPEWVTKIFSNYSSTLPAEYLKAMLERAMHEHVDSYYERYTIDEISRLIADYYNKSMELYGKVEVPHNILTQYGIIKYLHKQRRLEHYDERLATNNNKTWLYYENDDYIVRPLLTRQAFHEEAEAQHNCVERIYMELVYNGNTHIVTVRRKSEPEKSYITCEVNKRGQIVQYLLWANNYPTKEEDLLFRKEYIKHLKNAIKE